MKSYSIWPDEHFPIWWFLDMFYFHPEPSKRWFPFWLAYFSDGLVKKPPTRKMFHMFIIFLETLEFYEIPLWWLSNGNPLISGKPRLVKYHNLTRWTFSLQGTKNVNRGLNLKKKTWKEMEMLWSGSLQVRMGGGMLKNVWEVKGTIFLTISKQWSKIGF